MNTINIVLLASCEPCDRTIIQGIAVNMEKFADLSNGRFSTPLLNILRSFYPALYLLDMQNIEVTALTERHHTVILFVGGVACMCGERCCKDLSMLEKLQKRPTTLSAETKANAETNEKGASGVEDVVPPA